MRILFVGDVVGRSGRDALKDHLTKLKTDLKVDMTVVNVDNAANGRGTTIKTSEEIIGYGADILTGGDHLWDQREMVSAIDNMSNVLRIANMPDNTPGKGYVTIEKHGHRLTVLHLGGQTFLDKGFENPFYKADAILQSLKLSDTHSIFVDFHAEASSEKMAMGQYLKGRVSAVIGSHTHIPTADCQILEGTGFQSDSGMTGDYDSVIGVKPEAPIRNFKCLVPKERMIPADGEATLCGTFIETDDKGLCRNIAPIRIGGRLSKEIPNF